MRRKRVPAARLAEVWQSTAQQAGGKFKYSNVDSLSQSRDIKGALELLIKAGLLHKVIHTSGRGIPLGADINPKRFKIIIFDVGIYQRMLGLEVPKHVVADEMELMHKGALAEVVTGIELLGYSNPRRHPSLYYWQREKRGSSAELDYIIQQRELIVPIEVKAGKTGKMRSMHMFLKERNIKRGLRLSLENFSQYENIETCPLYAIRKLFQQ